MTGGGRSFRELAVLDFNSLETLLPLVLPLFEAGLELPGFFLVLLFELLYVLASGLFCARFLLLALLLSPGQQLLKLLHFLRHFFSCLLLRLLQVLYFILLQNRLFLVLRIHRLLLTLQLRNHLLQ